MGKQLVIIFRNRTMLRNTSGKRSTLVRSIALLLFGSCFHNTNLAAADGTWTGNGAQAFGAAIWGGVGNWLPATSPSGSGSVISFTSSFTNGPSVKVNVSPTIGSIIFTNNTGNATNDNFSIKKNSATTNNFTLNNTLNGIVLSPVINVTQSNITLNIETNLLGVSGFTKTGPGKLILNTDTTTNVTTNAISGTVVVSGGILGLNQSSAIQNCLLDTTASLAGGATTGLSTNQTALTIGGLSGNKNFADLFTTTAGGLSGLANLTLNPASGIVANYTGNIANGATGMNLIKSGAGTQILTGTNTYSGTTTITAGTLQAGSSASLPSYNVASGVTLTAGTLIVNSGGSGWTTGQIDTLLTNTVKTSGATFGIDTTNADLTQWTPFTPTNLGTGIRFLKTGSNTLTFNQANTYSTLTTISGGTLALTGAGTLGNGTGGVTLSGGTLDLGGGSHTNAAISITAAPATGETIRNGNLTGTSYAASNTTGNAIISANLLPNATAGFAKTGAGTVTFSGTNTYTGTTSIAANGGTLLFSKTASLYNGNSADWVGSKITVASGGTLALGVGGTGEFSLADVTTVITNLSTSGFSSGALIGFDTTNAPGGTITYSSVIADSTAGTLGVAKLGSGTLVLSGDNTYSGATTVSGGTLNLTGNRTASTVGAFTVNTGATLGISNGTYTTGSTFSVGGTSGSSTVNQTGGDLSFSAGTQILVGNGSGDGVYNLSGGTLTTAAVANRGIILGTNTGRSGTLNLSGTGSLTIPSGSVLQIGRSENAAATATTGIFNQSGGTASIAELRLGGSTTGSANNANTTAQLNLSGGVFTATTFTQLSGGNTSNSTINISGTADVTLPDFPTARGTASTASITFNGGTLKPLVASVNYLAGLTSATIKSGGAKLDTTNGNTTITLPLLTDVVSLGGGLTKDGINTLTLTGANTYSGPTTISNGKLQLNSAAAGVLSTGSMNVGATGLLGFTAGTASVLDLSGKPFSLAGTIDFDIGSTGINDSITVGSFSLTGNSSFTFNPISPILNGGSYTLLTSSSPIVTGGFSLSGQNTGRLTLNPVINTNTITMTSTLFEGIWNQSGGGDWSVGNPSATGGNWNNYKPTVAGDAALFGSTITAPATINVDTPHSVAFLRFNNTNTVTIGSSASSNLTIDNGTAIGVIAVSSGSHVIAENVTLASAVSIAPSTGTTLTISGALSGSGSVQMIGTGNLILSNANSFSGSTIINSGTLSLSGSGSLNSASTIAIGAGATFAIDRIDNVNQGGEFSTAPISGAGGFTQAGTGTTTLNAVNTYTGPTTVTAGILQIISAGQLGAGNYAGAIQINTGAELQFNSSAAQTFSGVISGSGKLIKNTGTGTLILNGISTFNGGTSLEAGIINVTTNSTALGSGVVTFNGGARIVIDTSLTLANAFVLGSNIAGSGRGLIEAGTVTGTTTISGPITINASASAGGHFAAPTVNTTLHVAGPITSTVPVVARQGNVRFSGGGTGYTSLILSQGVGSIGANNGIATTAVVEGGASSGAVLDLNGFNQSLVGLAKGATGSFSIGNSSSVTDSTLTLTGASDFVGSFNDTIGTGTKKLILIKTGPDLVKLSGISVYSGGTTVSGGTLLINNTSGSGTGTGIVTVASGATLGGTGTIAGQTTVNGSISPGDSSVATLNVTNNVTWNASNSWLFELGTSGPDLLNPGTSDLLNITGNFVKGTGSSFSFDFAGTGSLGWYKLADWTTGTTFAASNFAASNLPSGMSGTFTVDNTSSALYIEVITATAGPSSWQGASNALWSATGSWTNSTVPSTSSDTALFANAVGAGSPAVLDSNQTVNALSFDSTSSFTINPQAAQVLSLAGTTPSINTAATNTGTQIVSVALNLGNGTTIAVNGGTLSLNSPIASVVGTGVSASTATGTTLQLAGPASSLNSTVNVTNVGTLSVTGTAQSVGNISGAGSTTVSSAGNSTTPSLIAKDIDQTALTINNGAYVRIAPSGTSTSVVTALTVGTTANLDISDNDVVINNPTPVAAASSLTAVATAVNAGFVSGGNGIVTTTTGTGLETVGFGLNSFLSFPTFNGVTVNDDSVLIKYTYFGDSNLDGFVTDDDLGYFLAGYGSDVSANPWVLGDYNHDGFTTDDDLGFFLAAYGSTPGLAGGGIQAIPEPSTLVLGTLVGLGLGALSLRRRRAKS
jgi:fibronectin-binding autotransporter adhesin